MERFKIIDRQSTMRREYYDGDRLIRSMSMESIYAIASKQPDWGYYPHVNQLTKKARW